MIRLRHEARLMLVAAAEGGELGVGDAEIAGVAQGGGGVVFAGDDEDLEAFPAEGPQAGEDGVHVFGVVEAADDCVELEFDSEFAAPGGDLEEFVDVVAAASADGDVGLLVEGVAGDGEDVDVFSE